MESGSDETFLLEALSEAGAQRGFCAPNPAVGAVVVKGGKIISRGAHHGTGSDHAEVEALKGLEGLSDATLYVTLEPCCHHGRTPPCTDFIESRGIRRVVFGAFDPNPIVFGKGQKQLLARGIACDYKPISEIDHFYQSYRYWTERKQPFVTAKLALSLDGKIAGRNGEPLQLTSGAAFRFTHLNRKTSDAILTTAKTIALDDPRLNARDGESIKKPLYLLDAEASLSPKARVFQTAKQLTLFHAERANPQKLEKLRIAGVELRTLPEQEGRLDLSAALSSIGSDGRHDLWVEAGGTLFERLSAASLLNRAFLYIAPKWIGELGLTAFPAFTSTETLFAGAKSVRWSTMEEDACLEVDW